MVIARLLSCLAAALLAGCASLPPVEQPVAVQPTGHTGGSVLAFAPGNRWIASGGWEGKVRFWSLPDAKLVRTLEAHRGAVYGIVFLPGGRTLLTAGYDGDIARWDTAGRLLERVSTGSPVTHMVANAGTTRIVTGHKDGSVRVWSVADLALLEARRVHEHPVRAVALSVDDTVASSASDGSVMVWRPGVPAVREFPWPPTDAWTLDFSPDGRWLMGGGWFRLFRWRVADGALDILKTPHHGIIKSLAYGHDGSFVASISRQTDSRVYFMDPHSAIVMRRFARHDLCGGYLVLSADGRYLATTADDADLRVWDLARPSP